MLGTVGNFERMYSLLVQIVQNKELCFVVYYYRYYYLHKYGKLKQGLLSFVTECKMVLLLRIFTNVAKTENSALSTVCDVFDSNNPHKRISASQHKKGLK